MVFDFKGQIEKQDCEAAQTTDFSGMKLQMNWNRLLSHCQHFAMYHLAVSGLWMSTAGIYYIIISAAINRQLTFHSATTLPSLAEWTKDRRAKTGKQADKEDKDEVGCK